MPIVGDLLAGRYRIVGPLGAGGMASVWRAHDERLDRDVAVKVLLPNLAADPALAARFDREARSLAAAGHPAIVSIFDVEPGDPATGREPFYVMELCDGGSLADRLADGPLPPDDAVHVLAAVAEGLAALHDRGIVHRDVKPGNILTCGGRTKLADFGLARPEQATDASALTMAGTVAGTLAYLAPELVRGGQASTASDAYALGVVAFQALTGQLPRPASSMEALVAASRAPAATVSSVAPHLGDAFDGPIAAALGPDPLRRQDPLGLAADLVAGLGRWRRAGGPTRQPPPAHAAAPPEHATAPVDTEARTVLVRGPVDERRSGRLSPLLPMAAFAGLALALAWLLGAFGSEDRSGSVGPTPSQSAVVEPTASPSAEPTPTPTAEPTPEPTPTPAPTSTPDPRQPAFDALDDVRRSIDFARNEGGLRQPDANDLRRVADEVEAALSDGNFKRANDRAKRLLDLIDELDELSDEVHDPMLEAAAALEVETNALAEAGGS
ncbi:MAG TPA: serine/threonine-protein kinase [Candidatus Limnocylindrales bacterium]|nr:serine/threonine-protein kinase [Candidatus Limnocylindrales bacterium]